MGWQYNLGARTVLVKTNQKQVEVVPVVKKEKFDSVGSLIF